MNARAGRRAGALAGLGVVALVCVGTANASNLGTTSKKASAGRSGVSVCGTVVASMLSWNVAAGNITSVTLTGLPAGCVGGRVSVVLRGASNVKLAEVGPVLLIGTTQRLSPLTANPAATLVLSSSLAVTGP
jgi:hypothetical protein